MKALVILAHPEPSSFNGHLARVAARTLEALGHEVTLVDLHAMRFDPLEEGRHYASRRDAGRFDAQAEQRHAVETGALPREVQEQIALLEASDFLFLQYPMWWHSMPAILKGWLDRCFVYGRLYTGRQRFDRGVLRGRRAMVSVTTGAPASTFLPDGRSGDIDLLLWPMHYALYMSATRCCSLSSPMVSRAR